MLVLSRKNDEAIHIQVPGLPDILVRVVGIRGDAVRLGVVAPHQVKVHRAEIVDRISKEGSLRDSQPAQADPGRP